MAPNRPKLPTFDENNPARRDAPGLRPSFGSPGAGVPFPIGRPSPLRPRVASLTKETERRIVLRRFPRAVSISGADLSPRPGLEAGNAGVGEKAIKLKELAINCELSSGALAHPRI